MPDDKHALQSIIPVADTAKSKTPHLKLNSNIICGFSSAALTSVLFHPLDRALYLTVRDNQPFLTWTNFQNPLQGLKQTICQRAAVNGMYYIFQGELQGNLLPFLRNQWGASEPTAQFCLGIVAGAGSGILTNPFTAIKYYAWGKEGGSFVKMASEMWSKEGSKAFLKGVHITVSRDLLFAAVYEPCRVVLRRQFSPDSTDQGSSNRISAFAANSIAGGLAMLVSSPLQYVRNKQFATPLGEKIFSTHKILGELIKASAKSSSLSRLQIGWNIGRVALGISVNQFVCDDLRKKIAEVTPEATVDEAPRKRLR